MRIGLEPPGQPEVSALIDALDAYQKPMYPPESHHGIDLEALSRPNVLFAVARDAAGRAVACGAIVLESGYGEIKRMYVMPEERGRGIARALLRFLEETAAARGVASFALETGNRQHDAIALYVRAGYVNCDPFGGYQPDPHSVFMRKDRAA
jgi:putative acetyltransferase